MNMTRIALGFGVALLAFVTAPGTEAKPRGSLSTIVLGAGLVVSDPEGISCPPDCTATFRRFSTVTLKAVPDGRQDFIGWAGPCQGDDTICVFSIPKAIDVTAAFTVTALPPAPVPRTGQTTCYDGPGDIIYCEGTGQDGETRSGVPSLSPRFSDNDDETITDQLTGLVWLQNLSCLNTTWVESLLEVADLADGQCNLTDGSFSDDWRLPSINELRSLFDYETGTFPNRHPFVGVGPNRFFWSSTTDTHNPDLAFVMNFGNPIGFGGENDRLDKDMVAAWGVPLRSSANGIE